MVHIRNVLYTHVTSIYTQKKPTHIYVIEKACLDFDEFDRDVERNENHQEIKHGMREEGQQPTDEAALVDVHDVLELAVDDEQNERHEQTEDDVNDHSQW